MFNPDCPAVEATFLGPTFGGPISQLVMFKSPSAASDGAFLAYRTSERVVGLIAWPLDGDPARTMGLIAHPGEVRSIAISYDGRKLLTAGACVWVWGKGRGALGVGKLGWELGRSRPRPWARTGARTSGTRAATCQRCI